MHISKKNTYDSISSFGLAVFHAIENSDCQAVEYIFNTKDPDDIYNQGRAKILFFAYKTDNIKIAEFLINHGAKFESRNILHTHAESGNITEYYSHLDQISEHISYSGYEQALGVLNSLISGPLILYDSSQQGCLNITSILGSVSFSNNVDQTETMLSVYNSLSSLGRSSIFIGDTLKIAAGSILDEQASLLLIVPQVKNAERSAIYVPNARVEGDNIIYMPFFEYNKYEKAVLVHELGHFAQDALFRNNVLPYSNREQAEIYHGAVKEFVSNVVKRCHTNSSFELVKHNIGLGETDDYSVIKNLNTESFLSLFLYPSYSNDHLYIEDMFKLYFLPTGEISENHDTFQYKSDYIAKLYSKMLGVLELSAQDAIVLDRSAEALLRPEHTVDAEIIVRIAELEIKGMGSEAMAVFKPIMNYWVENIRPAVQDLPAIGNLPDCTNYNSNLSGDETISYEVLPV